MENVPGGFEIKLCLTYLVLMVWKRMKSMLVLVENALKRKKNAFASGVRINAIAKFDKMQDEN